MDAGLRRSPCGCGAKYSAAVITNAEAMVHGTAIFSDVVVVALYGLCVLGPSNAWFRAGKAARLAEARRRAEARAAESGEPGEFGSRPKARPRTEG